MLSDAQFRNLVSGAWKGPAAEVLRGALSALERPYGWVVRRRNSHYNRGLATAVKLPAPVISVGNLTVGGTGKSPFVAWLARWLMERGVAVTIISRGYGARGNKPNDEALELASRLPGVSHLQNPDRVAAATAALAANSSQVLILDDAFQHRRLARDLDIVLLDALAPFGYGHLLPRGLLREPIGSLARASVVALTRSDAVDETTRKEIEMTVRDHAPQTAWIELVHRPRRLISVSGETEIGLLRERPVAAFCGIGNPAGFRHTLAGCGLGVTSWLELPDHCPYEKRDMKRLQEWLTPLPVRDVICTHKDLVKIPHKEIAGKRLWALQIELEVMRGQEEFKEILKSVVTRT
jgi:tetraacyldisaccharide 4'-kinase